MGREVCREVAGADDLALVAAVDPSCSGRPLPDLAGPDVPGLTVAGDVTALETSGARVAVDFTVAESARRNLAWCAEAGIHVVVGTSGLNDDDLEAARHAFAHSAGNALIVPNFAIGAVLLMKMCELAAPLMDGVEIIELHHGAKRDAPSGTAVRTAERIAAARLEAGSAGLSADPTTLLTIEGARGATGAGGVRIHSVRLPGLVAHQEVIFGMDGETLSIRHDSIDRASFMPGVLAAVRGIANLPGVTVGLETLLGL